MHSIIKYFTILFVFYLIINPSAQKSGSRKPKESDTSETELILLDDALRFKMEMAGANIRKKGKRMDYSTSKTFVLNTMFSVRSKQVQKPNDDRDGVSFSNQYNLPKSARVIVEIVQNGMPIKKLFEEDQAPGRHYVTWNGLDENGIKQFGDFECLVNYTIQNGSSKVQRIKFKVIK